MGDCVKRDRLLAILFLNQVYLKIPVLSDTILTYQNIKRGNWSIYCIMFILFILPEALR